jgi:hypothetical protein
MATARTKSDALGFYASDPAGLGGIRADFELCPMEPIISTPIGPIIVQHITPKCGVGSGTIRAASTTTLAYKAPGDTEGTAVSVPANTAVLLESGTAGKACRVYRDSVYNADSLGGSMSLDINHQYNNVIAGPNATEAAGNYYGCYYIHNHSDATITGVALVPAVLGTQRTSNSTQLSGAGSGTITTTGSLADWPTSGWCHVRTSGGTTQEVVYYTSRTATALTVPAAGRGLLGTSATAGGATDTINAVAPIRVWTETPTAGAVQTIADNTTAPSGASWAFTITVGTLLPGEERAVWIHRQVPAAATVNLEQLSGLYAAWTYSAVAYEQTSYGYFRIGDTTLEDYTFYLGDGAAPTYASPTTVSATLPFTSALAADSTYYYVTRQRNRYGLLSFNTLAQRRDIDAGGVDVTNALTDPTDITLTSAAGGTVDLTLTYRGSTDATMADTWRLYITTDGSTPDPVTDTPADTAMSAGGFGLNDITQTIRLGPYAYDTVLKVIARVYSTTLLAESASTTVTTETVDTQYPVQAGWLGITSGGYRGHARSPYEKETAFGAATVEVRNGETVVSGTTEVFRGVIGNGRELRTALELYNVAHSAAGTSAPIEAVSADEIYINVASTRRAKLDLTNGRIEAATFDFSETAIALPVIGPTHTTTTETYLMVLNGVTGRWTPILKVNSSGVLTTTAEILQEN